MMKKSSKLFVCGHTTNSLAEPRRSVGLALLAADAGRWTNDDKSSGRVIVVFWIDLQDEAQSISVGLPGRY